MEQKIETIVIGGGQAGLSASYFLTQHNREHVILEQADMPGSAWKLDRWDSFTLVTPNWTFHLPGANFGEKEPDGFMSRDQIVASFQQFAAQNHAPLHFGVQVTGVEKADGGFKVSTAQGAWSARNVIVATGMYQAPKIFPWSASIPKDIFQTSTGKYRNPQTLPPGAVLVIGSGQSGCQIAEELYQSGRKVYLSVGRVGRAPRRYRGKDAFDWLNRAGFLDRTPDKLPSPQARFAGNPQLTGKDGGHSLNLHIFNRDGVTLLGRTTGMEDGILKLAPDLKESLAKVDGFESMVTRFIDDYIQRTGLEAPEEQLEKYSDGYSAPELTELDLKKAGIGAVIWATGYNFDFSMIRLPVFDDAGFPISQGGVTASPGLYFVGLPWMPGQRSGLLMGVGDNAARVVEHILTH
jgi:putative flavoprotein involved in K+ transport